MTGKSDNRSEFHAPLREGDTRAETVGCRHTHPNFCAKNLMPNICAFVREDGICKSRPRSWPKQYEKLRASPPAAAERPVRTPRTRKRGQ